MIHINAFTQCTPISQSIGQWRNPADRMAAGYRDLAVWTDLARTLEAGCIDALFFADIHGIYDGYGASHEAAVQHAVQVPGADPTLLIPALAAATTHLGFAVTYSTSYHAPYECARLFSSLDHFTGGRIGWNVVTSYMKNAAANGLGAALPHDERYDQADDYMEAVYKLWEGSWAEDAVVRDAATATFSDPARVRTIDHHGPYYEVRGPHMCEPSIQRTPVIYQAGSSPRGIQFGAKHGEALFVAFGSPQSSAKLTARIRQAVAEAGRDPASMRIMLAIMPIVGETEAEARRKYETALHYADVEGALALFGGWTGIDLSQFSPDDMIEDIDNQAMASIAKANRGKRLKDFYGELKLGAFGPKIIGSPTQVADELERWVEVGGVDGFNITPVVQPGSHEDFVHLVVPELQRRGLFRRHYEGATLREHYFGPGHSRAAGDHPSARYRFA